MNKLIVILSISALTCSSPSKSQETIIKGIVHDWPTDTVYFCELPFHSPYSYTLQEHVFKKDSSFRFVLDKKDKAFTVFISPLKKVVDQELENLLFNNLTDQHYWGHCIKVYTYGVSTFLIEPGKGLDIELTYSSWPEKVSPQMYKRMKDLGATTVGDDKLLQIGQTEISFNNASRGMHEYYQTSFNFDNKCDMALSRASSGNINFAFINLQNSKKKLLSDLEKKREELNPVFYEYLFAEIEFGAKKEFLKYLRNDKEDYLKEMIVSGEVPEEIAELIAFDHTILTDAMMINEEYIEYLEFYLNFMKSLSDGEYKPYHPFDMSKLELVVEELPNSSAYYYLANQFLHTNEIEQFASICERFLEMYPDWELNKKLKKKYSINYEGTKHK